MHDDDMEKDDAVFQAFLKATTDALDDHSGGCIDKMINAFSSFGFNVQHTRNEDGTHGGAYVNGDEGVPEIFFKKKKR